jgi:nicotinate-nucleotide adenylyltransferase
MVILVIIESNDEMKRSGLAIMGGTFDPVHNGHLRTAVEVLDRYRYSELKLIPCFQPVHKGQPGVTPLQRLEMAKLAVSSHPRLSVDPREIDREGPSYSVDTLRDIRAEIGPDRPLIMVLGMDSFLSLPTWQEWRELVQYAHLLVVSRPGWEPDLISELNAFCENYRASASHELQCAPSGLVWFETLTPLGISSSMIRNLARKNESIAYLLPEPVQKYIEQHKLYR